MSEYLLRTAQFKVSSFGEEFVINVRLYEKNKGIKDYLLSPQGTFWVEASGWKSELFKTKKRADYAFESKCLEHFVDELFSRPDRMNIDELANLFPFFADRGGNFEYFKPESKDFLFLSICSELHSRTFEQEAGEISKAIGKPLLFPKLPDDLYNALIWEIRPNSAKLYKAKIVEDFMNKQSNYGFTIVGNKEYVYTYPNYVDLLMSFILKTPASLPNNLSWLDD